jgi:hypothetical protein
MSNYISVVDENDRKSTLDLQDDGIQVIGVLPHNSIIVPDTVEDAEALIDWLEDFIDNFSEETDDETEED